MPRQGMNRQSPAPPSPVCSDTVSLPDTMSDLDNLSDYSGISISDDDEKNSRNDTDSESEQFPESDFEQITHSMVTSRHARSPVRSPVRRSKEIQIVSEAFSEDADTDKTPSASLSKLCSTPSVGGDSGDDMAHMILPQPGVDNLFGLSLDSICNPEPFEEERGISEDEDLATYSVLDSRGHSIRSKHRRSGTADSIDMTVQDSATVSGSLPEAAVEPRASGSECPSVESRWLDKVGETKLDADPLEQVQVGAGQADSYNESSPPASWQKCGPKWLNKQTFGIFGVVLLGVAAFHIKKSPWLATDTSALFLNHSSLSTSALFTSDVMATTQLDASEAVGATLDDPHHRTESLSSATVTDPGVFAKMPREPSRTASAVEHTLTSAPSASLPSSVTALVSMASSGLASLCNHVISISAQPSVSCNNKQHFQSTMALRQQVHPCSTCKMAHEQSTKDTGARNQQKAVQLAARSVSSLSMLPKKAQKGLSTPNLRSSTNSSPKQQNLATGYNQRWTSQVGRRVEERLIRTGETAHSSLDISRIAQHPPTSEDSTQHSVVANKAVRAPFSRLSAAKLWDPIPPTQYDEAVTDGFFHGASWSTCEHGEQLFLGTAEGLPSLSFEALCKRLDKAILPYLQNIFDVMNALDYPELWSWIQSTIDHCKRILSPYLATIGAYGNKEMLEGGHDLEDGASSCVVKVDRFYSRTPSYLESIRNTYAILTQHYRPAAPVQGQGAIHFADRALKASANKVYGQSRVVLHKASRNARKILIKGFPRHRKQQMSDTGK